jgi:hypothetical protein
MLRGDRLHAVVNVNGWCDSGANDVLAARVAPLQISYMGYPGIHPLGSYCARPWVGAKQPRPVDHESQLTSVRGVVRFHRFGQLERLS